MIDKHADSQTFVTSFARGLAVIEAFRGSREPLRLSEIARRTQVDRAVARRLLLTLVSLGYVREHEHRYELTPRVLRLGYSYLAQVGLDTLIQPFVREMADTANESCSVSVLDETESVSVAHAPSPLHRTGLLLQVGTRWPAYIMASGRVLLSGRSDEEVGRLLAKMELKRFTSRTLVEPAAILEEIRVARERGYALIDQELEDGLLSISVPVRDAAGQVKASLNVSSSTNRMTPERLVAEVLPDMRRISHELGRVMP